MKEDRAKYVEQFDDILRTFMNDSNKFENGYGTVRDEEKMFPVKKLMPESLLNYRFRGTTMSYSKLPVPTARHKKIDTSASMEIGMTAKDDVGSAREEGDQRIVPCIAGCLQRNWQRKVEF